jgi:hypothetical protein
MKSQSFIFFYLLIKNSSRVKIVHVLSGSQTRVELVTSV